MAEKRKYPRYSCTIKTVFEYYEGNPEEIDFNISIPKKGKGFILDISRGGVFIITNERVNIGSPIIIKFPTKSAKYDITGDVIRIGFLKNNPSEVAKKFMMFSKKGDSYIAVEFNEALPDLQEKDLPK